MAVVVEIVDRIVVDIVVDLAYIVADIVDFEEDKVADTADFEEYIVDFEVEAADFGADIDFVQLEHNQVDMIDEQVVAMLHMYLLSLHY